MANATPDIDVYSGGIVVLRTSYTGLHNYYCTSATIIMELDQLPFARITIGSGSSIAEAYDDMPIEHVPGQTPEDLLSLILDKRSEAYTGMVEAWLYELDLSGDSKKEKCVFQGLITTGSIIYSSNTPATKQIELQIMNKAIEMHQVPLGLVMSVTDSFLVRIMKDRGSTGQSVNAVTSESEAKCPDSLTDKLYTDNKSKRVLDHVAAILDDIIFTGAYQRLAGEALRGKWADKLKNLYLCGDWEFQQLPSSKGDITTVMREFDNAFKKDSEGLMQSSSVYTALTTTLLSEQYMLTLTPRWVSKGFRLELGPSCVWSPLKTLALPLKYINGIDTAYNPSVSLNVPDVFIVNYYDSISSMYGEEAVSLLTDRPGVYSVNSKLETLWKTALAKKEMPKDAGSNRVRIYRAPTWLSPLLVDGTSSSKSSVRDHATAKASGERRNPARKTNGSGLSDIIAKALFGYIYGMEDKCTLSLSPALLFGRCPDLCLEDSLGAAVDLELPAGMGDIMSIRGILSRVAYSYRCDKGRVTVNYSIDLKGVRPLNKKEVPIPCPLYKLGGTNA